MANSFNQNYFTITVNGTVYTITASYENIYLTRFKIETNGEHVFTLVMNEEGNWEAEKDAAVQDEILIEQIGRAIEEFDLR